MKNNKNYVEFFKVSMIIQTRLVTLLTSCMYIVYSIIDLKVLPQSISSEASFFHLFVIAPILAFISILTFRKDFYSWGVYFLMLSPILAGIGNFIIVINAPNNIGYLVETYLIIFWLFTLSGLSFNKSVVSVFIILIATYLSTVLFNPLSPNTLIVHIFWIFCSSSFGILIAFLLNRQNRVIFENYNKMKEQVLIDELTKIYNRKKVDEFLPQEIKRCIRFNHIFSFVMIDIDYFKEVNDKFGHHTGDIVLKQIVNIINNKIRATDVFIRWGGEEFIIICLETSLDEVTTLLERIKTNIEEYDFEEIGTRTVSMGVTMFRKDDDLISLLKRTDEALYKAKHRGRNCIEVS